MAITVITQPSPTTPILTGQYTQQNKYLNANLTTHGPDAFVLTDLESTVSAPLIKQGCYIRHAGKSYQVDTADEAISGSVSAGLNYVKLTVSGSTLLASWVIAFTGYLYNEAYQGWYSGTDQILPQGVYLDGTTYNRMKAVETRNKSVLTLGNGRTYYDDVNIDGVDTVSCNRISATGATASVILGLLSDSIQSDFVRAGGTASSDYSYLLSEDYIKQVFQGAGPVDHIIISPAGSSGIHLSVGSGDLSGDGTTLTVSDNISLGTNGLSTTSGNITSSTGDITATSGDLQAPGGFIQMRIVTTLPAAGNNAGDLIIWNDGGTYRLICWTGSAWAVTS